MIVDFHYICMTIYAIYCICVAVKMTGLIKTMLYSPYYTPGIFADGYIVFVFPFVCSSVRMFVSSYFRHVRGICVKVLRQSFSSGVYLSNYKSESLYIWTIVTLEGWHSLHDPGPQGPCPWVGLEVKI